MRKQRIIGVILLLSVLFISTGCTQDTSDPIAPVDPVLEAAIEMAYADFSLMKLAINGSEYIEMTEKHLIKPEIHYQKTVFGFDGVMYNVNTIKEFDEQEIASAKVALINLSKEFDSPGPEEMESIFVSEVIEDVDFSFKYIIARIEGDIRGQKTYFFKKYTFVEDDDKWRVLTAKDYIDFIEEPRDPNMMQQYLEYDGKQIDYSREIDLAEFIISEKEMELYEKNSDADNQISGESIDAKTPEVERFYNLGFIINTNVFLRTNQIPLIESMNDLLAIRIEIEEFEEELNVLSGDKDITEDTREADTILREVIALSYETIDLHERKLNGEDIKSYMEFEIIGKAQNEYLSYGKLIDTKNIKITMDTINQLDVIKQEIIENN